MEDSILKTTKKLLGLGDDYTPFDLDVIIHINTALSTLHDLGIGPANGFAISSESEKWVDFLGDDPRMSPAKSYVFLKVKHIFDPPTTGYLVQAHADIMKELEWRLNAIRESDIPFVETIVEEI
jgi:hypothetical protein